MRPGSSECGMISLVMVVVLFLAMMLSVVVVELSRFWGVRDWMQGLIDDNAHQAIVRSLARDQIRDDVRVAALGTGLVAEISEVRATAGHGVVDIAVSGRYGGSLLPFLSTIVGGHEMGIPFSVRTRARVQRGSVLVVVDRHVSDPLQSCGDGALLAMTTFADRLVSSFEGLGYVSFTAAVAPGELEPVDVVMTDGSDGIRRCGPKLSDAGVEMLSIAGSNRMVDSWDAASGVADLAAREFFSDSGEYHSVVILMRQEALVAGYAALAREFLEQVARSVQRPIDLYVFVLDGRSVPVRGAGSYGGLYRELGVTQRELKGASLVGAVARSVRDRIVLEF